MKITIAGAAGRMGQMLIREIARTEGASLAAALEGPGSNQLGTEAAKGVKIVADAAQAIGAAEAVIDFTVPAATVAHARVAADKGVAMVIGTTGLSPEQSAEIHAAAKKVPILWAANMAVGVNVLLSLVEKTAAMLDPAYDIEVLEMHHRHKIDAPSGTALALGQMPIFVPPQNTTIVTLTATPATGYSFGSWTNCDSESGALCTMTMDAAKSGVTASFSTAISITPRGASWPMTSMGR